MGGRERRKQIVEGCEFLLLRMVVLVFGGLRVLKECWCVNGVVFVRWCCLEGGGT